MNIAEITTYKEGGVYTHVIELIKKATKEHNFIVITGNTKRNGFQKEDNILYFHIPCIFSTLMIYFINPMGSYKRIRDLMINHNIDVVHFHNPLFTFLNTLIKKREWPLVMTAHYVLDLKGNRIISKIYKGIIKLVTQYIGKKIDRIICVNKDYIQIFQKWGVDPKKLVFIPNGIDTSRFTPGKSVFSEAFKDEKVIIFFGRLHYQKNVDLLIKGFQQISYNRVKLLIIGDGPDANRLHKLSRNDENIIFTGRVSDEELVEYLRVAYMMVLPSRGETASLTLMEAMACGLPVIASDVGNNRSILDNGRGLLLEKYTPEDIAQKCEYLLIDEAVANQISRKGQRFIKEHYSLNQTVTKTLELYKELKQLEQRKT